MSSMIESLKHCTDSILGIRASIGADLRKVFLVTRTWSGDAIGDGYMTEDAVEVLPTPGIKDMSHSLMIKEGGGVKQGDLIIKMISKHMYPLESDIDCSSDDPKLEKLYKVGDFYYRFVTVVEKQLCWNVQIRRLSDQRSGA